MACNVVEFKDDHDTTEADSIASQLLLKDVLGQEWTAIQWTPSSFDSSHFLSAMHNLIRNPNITSSHLFRADILYDSDNDQSTFLHTDKESTPESSDVQHLQSNFRPLPFSAPGSTWHRTIVRELIPRNRQADAPLVQTCHIFSLAFLQETTLVVYLPHLSTAEACPFYHPPVRGRCFVHTQAGLALHLRPFPSHPLPSLAPKLGRTTLRLFQSVHKLARGAADGYQKRVHHDVVVPQRRFQEAYARLKEKYAKRIIEDWREQTDPGKHVFEDLAIAAFLTELWASEEGFKGFVDIGCGNGLLVYLLISEGYKGWGFDVRRRKSWDMYPPEVQELLQVKTLVPGILDAVTDEMTFHSGEFGEGTFIISNHADELTAWTPLIAALNGSPFVAIPCCSHDLGGNRFRAPKNLKRARNVGDQSNGRLYGDKESDLRTRQAAETGSLRQASTVQEPSAGKTTKKTQPSAYSALCKYVSLLAETVGYEPETEMLRIPSTRNACIVGRKMRDNRSSTDRTDPTAKAEREATVRQLIVEEMDMPIDKIRTAWLARAEVIAGSAGRGH